MGILAGGFVRVCMEWGMASKAVVGGVLPGWWWCFLGGGGRGEKRGSASVKGVVRPEVWIGRVCICVCPCGHAPAIIPPTDLPPAPVNHPAPHPRSSGACLQEAADEKGPGEVVHGVLPALDGACTRTEGSLVVRGGVVVVMGLVGGGSMVYVEVYAHACRRCACAGLG